MADKVTVTGKQFINESAFRTDVITRPSSIDILLFNDSTDSLSETSNLIDITTEPGSGNYSRQTVNLDSSDVTVSEDNSNNYEVKIKNLTFDTTNESQDVDGWGIVANFDGTDSTGGNNGDNLIATGSLSQTRNLDQIDTFNVNDITLELD